MRFDMIVVTLLALLSSCSFRNFDVTAQTYTSGTRGWKDRSLQTVPVGKVDQLILYNAITDLPLLTLVDGMVVNTATLNVTSFNIQATTVNGMVGSVKFGYNEKGNVRIESSAPYAICGNIGANYNVCSYLVVGQHNITVTSYSGIRANGTIGSVLKLSFRVVNIPVSCNIPKVNATWQTYTPEYPINSPESQAELVGTDLVSFGGFNGDFTAVTNVTYARDISGTDRPWRRMEDMPMAIGITHAATVVIGMKIYMCGGYVGRPPGPHVAHCFIYDHSKAPGTGQWSNFATLPNNGSAGGGMIYDTGRNALYYTGGAQRPYLGSRLAIDQNNTWKFSFDNPSSGWVASAPIPYKANHQSYVTVHYQGLERHFFAGGQLGENELNGNVADTFEFITSTETWVPRASMPYGRSHTTTSTRAYGCGFIMAGGSINSFTRTLNRTNDIHYYHIPSDSWTYITSLPRKKATPKVFLDEDSDYMYYVDWTMTSCLKLSAE